MKFPKNLSFAIILISIIFLITITSSQEITTKTISTTFPQEPSGALASAERFYEITEKSLELGYNATLTENSAFKTIINGKERYIVANNLSNNSIDIIFIGSGQEYFNQKLTSGNHIIFKIEEINLKLFLESSNSTTAKLQFTLFEDKIPQNTSYFELFDIQVKLNKKIIYSPAELFAIVEFKNFGEATSQVRIIYSIQDSNGKEYFTGIDEKIIETNEIVIKYFENLNIEPGEYLAKTTIYYGDNQEATSQENFTLKKRPIFEILKQPLIFIGIILAGFIIILIIKKKKSNTNL